VSEYGSLVLISGNLPFKTEVAAVRILSLNEHIASLDAPLEIDPNHTIGEIIADDSGADPESLLQISEIGSLVDDWLGQLSERQRTVIERRYGLNGADVATLDAIATDLGLTRERGRQAFPVPEVVFTSLLGRFGLPRLSRGALGHIKYPVVTDDRAFRAATGFTHDVSEGDAMREFRRAFPPMRRG